MRYIWILLLAVGGHAQDEKKPHPGVDSKKIDEAIEKGTAWLLKQEVKPWGFDTRGMMRHHELALYTLLHAGIDREQELFKKLLKEVLETRLERTYCVSLQAMLLLELDAVKYQGRLAQCGQFLVDNQLANGQWGYGKEVPQEEMTSKGGALEDVATGSPAAPGSGKAAIRKPKEKITIRRRQPAPTENGDNSNSQYAALGLRACMEANVWPPPGTLVVAKKWWEDSQNRDGGWSYRVKGEASSGSMTAGGAGSLIIYKHYLKERWKEDPGVLRGFQWMVENFTVTENARTGTGWYWYYYYLYAMERLGILSGQEKMGSHEWYREGAVHLLKAQQADGTWYEGNSWGGTMKDTCFAILFLRRATIALPKVATGGR